MKSELYLVPLTRVVAQDFVGEHHRHHSPPVGDLFRVGAAVDGDLVGVVMIGRPVSRELQHREPQTCEVIRLCVCAAAPRNTPSFLLGAAQRAAWALGYTRIISYTLQSESGASMRGAGYRVVGQIKGRSWNMPSRPRVDGHVIADRLLWEVAQT